MAAKKRPPVMFQVRLRRAEVARLHAAAAKLRFRSTSEWVRTVMLPLADTVLKEPAA